MLTPYFLHFFRGTMQVISTRLCWGQQRLAFLHKMLSKNTNLSKTWPWKLYYVRLDYEPTGQLWSVQVRHWQGHPDLPVGSNKGNNTKTKTTVGHNELTQQPHCCTNWSQTCRVGNTKTFCRVPINGVKFDNFPSRNKHRNRNKEHWSEFTYFISF